MFDGDSLKTAEMQLTKIIKVCLNTKRWNKNNKSMLEHKKVELNMSNGSIACY
jgi:hypothetical protein